MSRRLCGALNGLDDLPGSPDGRSRDRATSQTLLPFGMLSERMSDSGLFYLILSRPPAGQVNRSVSRAVDSGAEISFCFRHRMCIRWGLRLQQMFGRQKGAVPYPCLFAEESTMLRWALLFLVNAIIAAVFGFGGVAADAAWIAKILFVVFLILFLVSLVFGGWRGGVPPP